MSIYPRMYRIIVVLFLLDLAPSCDLSKAHADIPPLPSGPCYSKKEGDACKIPPNVLKGTCVEHCYERGVDERRKYQSCSLECQEVKKPDPALTSMNTMPQADAAPEPERRSSCSLRLNGLPRMDEGPAPGKKPPSCSLDDESIR